MLDLESQTKIPHVCRVPFLHHHCLRQIKQETVRFSFGKDGPELVANQAIADWIPQNAPRASDGLPEVHFADRGVCTLHSKMQDTKPPPLDNS